MPRQFGIKLPIITPDLCALVPTYSMAEPLVFSPPSLNSFGVDLVELVDVARAMHDFGARYERRLFRESERARWPGVSVPESRLKACALSFATKEAAIKALELADGGVDWRDIEVQIQGLQVNGLNLHGRAADLAAQAGFVSWLVSSSISGDKALACVHARRLASPVLGDH